MTTIEWLPGAVDDLRRLHAFIEPHSAEAAEQAVTTIVEAAESLMAFPGKGKPWEPDTNFREWGATFGARGYVIRYRLFGDRVIIVRIWHGLENREAAPPA